MNYKSYALVGVCLAVVGGYLLSQKPVAAQVKTVQKSSNKTIDLNLKKLEKEYEATLGVYAIDTETNITINYNGEQRFAFASTYKALAGGLVLDKFNWDELNQTIMINQEDLVDYSPITEKYVGIGMPLKDIIGAAMEYSDNTAGNILFDQLGGPAGFQKELEKLGDHTTESVRYEPELNEAIPGDRCDTSTPKAIALDLKKLTAEKTLAPDKLTFYKKQLVENKTGGNLIRAGIPTEVLVGDKSGAASYGTRNDIAVLYPPNRKPIVLVIFSNKANKDDAYQDELIAKSAKLVSDYFNL